MSWFERTIAEQSSGASSGLSLAAVVLAGFCALSGCENTYWRETEARACPDCDPFVVDRVLFPGGLYVDSEALYVMDLEIPVLEAFALDGSGSRIVSDEVYAHSNFNPVAVEEELWFYGPLAHNGIVAVHRKNGVVRHLVPEELRQSWLRLYPGLMGGAVAGLSLSDGRGRIVRLDKNAKVIEEIDALDEEGDRLSLVAAGPQGVFWSRLVSGTPKTYELLTATGERHSMTSDALPLGAARFNGSTLYVLNEEHLYEYNLATQAFVDQGPVPNANLIYWGSGHYFWQGWENEEEESWGVRIAPVTNLSNVRFFPGAEWSSPPVADNHWLYLAGVDSIRRLPLDADAP